MLDMVQIHLTPENASQLDKLKQRQTVALDEVINEALSAYFFGLRFDELQERLSQPTAVERPITEDEVLDLIS